MEETSIAQPLDAQPHSLRRSDRRRRELLRTPSSGNEEGRQGSITFTKSHHRFPRPASHILRPLILPPRCRSSGFPDCTL